MTEGRYAVRALLVLLVLAAGALLAAAGPVAARSAAAVGAGTATLDDIVLILCAGASAALALLLAGGVLVDVAVVAHRRRLRGHGGVAPDHAAAGVLPGPLHRLVVAAVGAGLVAGAAGPAAAAATIGTVPTATATASGAAGRETPDGHDLDPSWAAMAGAGTAAEGGAATPEPAAPGPDGTGGARVPEPSAGASGWRPEPPPVPADLAAAEVLAPAPRPGVHPVEEVVVRRGDSLWAIAARHLPAGASDAAVAAEWPRWYAANRHVVGSDPDRLLPGQRLAPPP